MHIRAQAVAEKMGKKSKGEVQRKYLHSVIGKGINVRAAPVFLDVLFSPHSYSISRFRCAPIYSKATPKTHTETFIKLCTLKLTPVLAYPPLPPPPGVVVTTHRPRTVSNMWSTKASSATPNSSSCVRPPTVVHCAGGGAIRMCGDMVCRE